MQDTLEVAHKGTSEVKHARVWTILYEVKGNHCGFAEKTHTFWIIKMHKEKHFLMKIYITKFWDIASQGLTTQGSDNFGAKEFFDNCFVNFVWKALREWTRA